MKKLSGMQEELMEYVNERFFDGEKYYYCETGSCKPWNVKTVQALEDKGLVTVEAHCENTVFYLYKATPSSEDHFKAVNNIRKFIGEHTIPSYDNSDRKLKALYDEHLVLRSEYIKTGREKREQKIKDDATRRTAILSKLTDEEVAFLNLKR